MLPRYNKTIVARCSWDPWVFYTLVGGKMAPELYKTPWSPSQRATIV